MFSWRITAKGVEHIVLVLMGLFLVSAILIPVYSASIGMPLYLTAIMELLILIIVALFGMLYLLSKVWEIQVYGVEEHYKTGFFRKHDREKTKPKKPSKKKSTKRSKK
ncbi:MAG: hypothetical protein ACLFTH_01595 [Candidatus Woesearchaeota archaeon]